MFTGAESFSYEIADWDIENVNSFHSLFSASNLSTSNYDSMLINWAAQDVCDDVVFSVGSAKYSAAAADARQSLIDNYNWAISEWGLVP